MALPLLRDFKAKGRFDVGVTRMVLELADYCGVQSQYEKLQFQIPPMKVTPHYT